MMTENVVAHVLGRLKGLGIRDVFGVPGDYSFALDDAVCGDKEMRWIGCCNELNAAYAADGYARIKGLAALATTFGVGELSALNGVAGSFTEHLPVFHIVGMPGRRAQAERRIVHHTLGTGDFGVYVKMARSAACASAVLTPDNVVEETECLIQAALSHRRPVYMAVAQDEAAMPANGTVGACPALPSSDPAALESAVGAVLDRLASAKTSVVLAGYLISRLGLNAAAQAFIDSSGLPFATMAMDKTTLDETHPQYMGMYMGHEANPKLCAYIENCDCVLNIGALWSDFNTGFYTAVIDKSRMIVIEHHRVRIGNAVYQNVEMADMIGALGAKVAKRPAAGRPLRPVRPDGLGDPVGRAQDRITPAYLYPRWEKFFRPDDIIIVETGTVGFGLMPALMPRGASFHNQTLWGSIGWATPAAFGASLAAPGRRTVLVTGEGSHQFTAQEICQFDRFGLKPVIFCLNNEGYLIERLLCKDPTAYYNDLPQWNYSKLPEALGCKGWFTAKVSTNGQLEEAIGKAERCGAGAYIEVVMDKMAAPPLGVKLHECLQALYGRK